MRRTVYRVVLDGENWVVTRDGFGQVAGPFRLQSNAITYAKTRAKLNAPGRLVIEKPDGTIEEDYTFREDLRPPPGEPGRSQSPRR